MSPKDAIEPQKDEVITLEVKKGLEAAKSKSVAVRPKPLRDSDEDIVTIA
jgi:hypothetical protein